MIELRKAHLMQLIDLALETKDKEWFDKCVSALYGNKCGDCVYYQRCVGVGYTESEEQTTCAFGEGGFQRG